MVVMMVLVMMMVMPISAPITIVFLVPITVVFFVLRPYNRSGALYRGDPREGRNGIPTRGSNDIRHAVRRGQEERCRSPHRLELAQHQRSR
jgi:hypothetical protein